MPEIELRTVDPEDVRIFFEHQNDAEASAMASFTPRDESSMEAHWARILADPANTCRTILYDGDVAGNVVSWTGDDVRLVGYWIGRAFWGRGIATEALRLFLEADPHRPLLAHVAIDNVGSIRVLEKCGFETSAEHPVSPGDDGVQEMVMVKSGR